MLHPSNVVLNDKGWPWKSQSQKPESSSPHILDRAGKSTAVTVGKQTGTKTEGKRRGMQSNF